MPHFNLGSYRVDVGKLVMLLSFPKGRKGAETVVLVKPQSSILQGSEGMSPLPSGGTYECRMLLGVAIGEKVLAGTEPPEGVIMGYGVILDIMDIGGLGPVRKMGVPWTGPCLFDGSSIISDFVPSSEVTDPSALEVYLEMDGEQKASLTTGDLLMDVQTALRTASAAMTLYPGDIIGIEVLGTRTPIRSDSKMDAGISSVSIIRASYEATP
ncbi:MAG: fumarylacetoacetate hydrolase family protein [Candidatus Thermoplasmatota archaeon]|jgi:2-keto-4-pentenoate hydratase/2-oxohepta-3-ene-1,7-dioic acid hydratase in catechol pathway|nr:fumarylacetoacetate hydrolase family protein [Candidatus Thermoplasmatota archaeon]